MFKLYNLLIVLLLVSFSFSSAADVNANIKLNLSTSTSEAIVGQPFTLRCDLSTPVNGPGEYRLYLFVDDQFLSGHYTINVSPGSPYQHITRFDAFNQRNLHVVPAANNLTSFEFNITMQTVVSRSIYCYLNHLVNNVNSLNLRSNKISIASVRSPTVPPTSQPSVVFSSSVSKVASGQPFTATCTVSNYTPGSRGYRIQFFKQRDGLLATYEVDSTTGGQALLSVERRAGIVVNSGAHFVFPSFDIQIMLDRNSQEPEPQSDHYWCELQDVSFPGQPVHLISAKWPNSPLVDFHSIASGTYTRRGNCSIYGFDPMQSAAARQGYSVKFYTQMGPKNVNLIATFLMKPNLPAEFLSESLPAEFSSIIHGSSVFPHFQVDIKATNRFYGHWWCALEIGTENLPSFQKYESNFVNY